ncbi:GHKL domain-containing protein [Eubacterium uniforme]|uniref:GHKL domain-containing protein n=1 Tax=Eubacterium uniforme TaxID=39495 RepID=A0A1T4VFQ5_9FIRM|nr:sensor histidine kinase [Eubacterium uniforme]SKA63361.1 GHKL domain-containing protein [Eubacterium uniforme]
MTCGDKFFSILQDSILAIVGYTGEWAAILSVIMIMICFIGKEGSFNRKTLMPVFASMVIGFSLNMFTVIHDYLILRPSWNEKYEKGMGIISEQAWIDMVNTVVCLVIMILIPLLTFKRQRIINSICAFLFTMVFEVYITSGMHFSIMFFLDQRKLPIDGIINFYKYEGGLSAFVFTFTYLLIMLIFFLVLYFSMYKKHRTMYIGWKFRLYFILWEVLMIAILYLPFMKGLDESERERYMGYELGVIMLALCIVIPFFFMIIISRKYVLDKTLIQEEYISAELDYINQYKKNQTEIRAFRHDIINNLSMLSALHDEKNYDGAKEYIDTLLGNVKSMSPKYITGDEMLDCIVGMKAAKMDEEGIDFSLEGVIDGGLGMKAVDVCSIFANALDNAIEACEKIPKDINRWIKLSVKRTDKFFLIKLENSMNEEEKTQPLSRLFDEGERITTKKDKAHHGFGVQNMKETVLKYEGIDKVEIEDGVFILSIVIPRTN